MECEEHENGQEKHPQLPTALQQEAGEPCSLWRAEVKKLGSFLLKLFVSPSYLTF